VTVTVPPAGTVAGAVYKPPVVIVPVVEFPPVAPFTCQVTAVFDVFVTVAVNCCVNPTCTLAVVGAIATVTGGGAVTVTVAEALLLASAWEIAVTGTFPPVGTVAGAVYKPDVLTIPTVELPPVIPFTCQVTAVFVALLTVAVNCCVFPVCTLAVSGATLTLTAAVTVIPALDVLVVSAIEVAFSVTVAGVGMLAGALYVTEVVVELVSVPHVAPLHPVPDIDQVTPLCPVSFVSVAVKFCLPIPA
jgi:hypothetical protein